MVDLLMFFVSLSHEGVIQSQDTIRVSLCNESSEEGGLSFVKMQISNDEKVTLKLVVFFTFEQIWSNEE